MLSIRTSFLFSSCVSDLYSPSDTVILLLLLLILGLGNNSTTFCHRSAAAIHFKEGGNFRVLVVHVISGSKVSLIRVVQISEKSHFGERSEQQSELLMSQQNTICGL